MRFMIIVKASPMSEAESTPVDTIDETLVEEMDTFHEELRNAGVLLEGAGLKPSSKGWRVKYEGEKRTVIDGPFTETKELVAGYTLIQVKTREEALEWSRRFPNPMGKGNEAEIEVRELYEEEDFA
jgi:hypothetical protein